MTQPPRRFTARHPCPICGGHHGLAQGQGIRCFGFLHHTGTYARCTREEYAGSLPQNKDGTYNHRLQGDCRCGQIHGEAPAGVALRTDRPKRAPQRFHSYFTLAAFLKRHYGPGTTVTPWLYHDAGGCERFRILRIDYLASDGTRTKSYRPCHQGEDGRWHLARPDGLLPLYRLPAILAAPPRATIAVLEGEKCSDLATAIGLPHATTSAHGAKAPQLTNWSPLAGRTVAIFSDADGDGAKYAAVVSGFLATLTPAAEARIIRLPGLSDGEDIEQWIAGRRTAGRSDGEILAELHALMASLASTANAALDREERVQ